MARWLMARFLPALTSNSFADSLANSSIRFALLSALLCVLLAQPLLGLAQAYPVKPIRLIVPYAPGGALDIFARLAAQKMSESMGQTVLVDNRPGANSTLGSAMVARSAPDGYTFMATSMVHYMLPFFTKNVPYDVLKDFTPIVSACTVPNVLAVHPSLPVNSVKELIDYAKKNQAGLHFGTTGAGSSQHLAGLLLGQMVGIGVEHVPYKGGNPAVNDAVAGQIPMVILTAATIMPFARSGKLRALGLIEAKRARDFPELPTIGEFVPGYAVPNLWFGALGPPGLPAPILARINAEFRKAIQAQDVRARLEGLGFEVTGNTPEEFATTVAADVATVRRIVTAANIRPE